VELAKISVHLTANEQGFTRIYANIFLLLAKIRVIGEN